MSRSDLGNQVNEIVKDLEHSRIAILDDLVHNPLVMTPTAKAEFDNKLTQLSNLIDFSVFEACLKSIEQTGKVGGKFELQESRLVDKFLLVINEETDKLMN